MCELRGCDFVFGSYLCEFFGGDQGGCGHVAWSAFAALFGVWVWVDVDVLVEEFVVEVVVIGRVAKDVEGFVGVFNGQFNDGFVGYAGFVDDVVELGSVAGALVWWEDEELGDA